MNPAALGPEFGGLVPRTPRVLSIDDSELMHRLLRARLQLEQVEILCAPSGDEGIRLAVEMQPDVISMLQLLQEAYTHIHEYPSS